MPVISIQQFKEILEDYNYAPRHSRNTAGGQSAELFNRAGEKINNVKLKFLIQDDGGTWNDGTLIKPEFIWDFKKIIASHIVDNGAATNRLDLQIQNAKETADGIYFLSTESSLAINTDPYSLSGFNNSHVFFNAWFTPEYSLYNNSSLFLFTEYIEGSYLKGSLFSIRITPIDSTYFTIAFYSSLTTGKINGLLSGPFKYGFKHNFQIYFDSANSLAKLYVNGALKESITMDYPFYLPSKVFVSSGTLYKGEISYISMNFSSIPFSDTIIQNFYKFGYPLPRRKEYVDLSQEFEDHSRNLLIDMKTVDKAIENLKGQLYIKTNNITLKD